MGSYTEFSQRIIFPCMHSSGDTIKYLYYACIYKCTTYICAMYYDRFYFPFVILLCPLRNTKQIVSSIKNSFLCRYIVIMTLYD